MGALNILRVILRVVLNDRAALAAENLALRQQLAVLRRSATRPRLGQRDRIFWVWLSKLWTGWRSALVLVQPDTVVRWHRRGFKLYWRWKSRKTGRPRIDPEVRSLIRRISLDNPLWGTPRVQAELRLLGHEVAESTVARYMVKRRPGPPSQFSGTVEDGSFTSTSRLIPPPDGRHSRSSRRSHPRADALCAA